jgi:uncharacterized protein
MAVLIDTNILLAHIVRRDANHERARKLIRDLGSQSQIVVAPVLVELFHMAQIRLDYTYARQALTSTRKAFQVETLTDADLDRMEQIMSDYADAQFDFADVAIMAVAERLKITQIATLDRRDFGIYRPTHCDYLELLPD